MRLQTRICDLFGITHPILNAPMGGGDAPGALAAAVTMAGGLGMIGGTTDGDARWLVEQIRLARGLTEGPLGVGLLSQRPSTWRLMDAALHEGIRLIAHSFADPAPFVSPAHDAGALVVCQVRTVEDARRAADAGVDVITAQGTEAGGHTGHMSTATLVPAVVDAVAPLPVIAAGGVADGRSLAAMLVLGAEGVWIGTRFLASHESGIDDHHKQVVIDASADDTILTEVFDIAAGASWPPGVAGRAVRDEFSDRWHGNEDELRNLLRDAARVPSALADDARRARGMWAGEGVSAVTSGESAGDVVNLLVDAAAEILARYPVQVVRY